ncbi:MAG: tRNA (adenosine(37)-N6)-threonylcarbamoyltransferase complex dimerization subunit type 1 TsaB [Chitinispirillaceae bacterium]|nr:tRNA (adenosine(37)-N6)-threonylcarbamoyltransferase complex dimerization subunit type 1 TsaB [Chitinispirillaceae bacterium]
MSIIVGIDTSSTELSIGIYKDNFPLFSLTRFSGNSHAEHISATFASLVDLCGIKREEIERFAVTVGPGSFTGLRIGIAFVKGFCFGNNKAIVIPVSSLFVLANVAIAYSDKRIITAIDARNKEFYWASFCIENNKIVRITKDNIISEENFLSLVKEDDIVVTDCGNYKKSRILEELSHRCIHLEAEKIKIHRGLICASYGSEREEEISSWITLDKLKPNYIRKSAPEEKKVRV